MFSFSWNPFAGVLKFKIFEIQFLKYNFLLKCYSYKNITALVHTQFEWYFVWYFQVWWPVFPMKIEFTFFYYAIHSIYWEKIEAFWVWSLATITFFFHVKCISLMFTKGAMPSNHEYIYTYIQLSLNLLPNHFHTSCLHIFISI